MFKFKNLFSILVLFGLATPLFGLNVSKAEKVDKLIIGGTVVTMDGTRRVITDGGVAIMGDSIVAVGTRAEITKAYKAKQTINANGKAVIPGLVNTHTHIPMVLFRGIGSDLDLNDWLTQYIFPAEAKNVDEAFVRAGTRLGLAEMIRGGTTTYCDMYYFEDAIADETSKAGVRGVLGQTIIDFPAPDHKTPDAAINYTKGFAAKWSGNALITPAFAPHAPYTVSTANLKKIHADAAASRSPIVIHVAETKKEVDDITAKYGTTPMAYLNEIGFLGENIIAAHTVFLSDGEIDIMKQKGVGSAHCPHSNMKLASGVAPVNKMLLKDIAVGLGTDGAASNNDLDLWEEIDTAAKLQKVFGGDPRLVTAEQAFEMATIRGARALDLDKQIGSIEAGKKADIVLVDLDGMHQIPLADIYSVLVYSTKAADVATVMIAGRLVMIDRRLTTLNEIQIKKEAAKYRTKISDSLKANS